MKRDTSLPLDEPKHCTEFEVQAYLWHELRALGLNVRGEVKLKFSKRQTVRFDLACFQEGRLTAIIEVKRSSVQHKTTWKETRQGLRYLQYGVPVYIVYGMDEADVFITEIRKGAITLKS